MTNPGSEPTIHQFYAEVGQTLDQAGRLLDHMYSHGNYEGLRQASNMLLATVMFIESVDTSAIPKREVGLEQPDGSVAYVRMWDYAYEVNGHKVMGSTSKSYEDEANTLELFLDNPGQPFLVNEIAQELEFLKRLAPSSRATTFSNAIKALEHKAAGTNLFSRGTLSSGVGRPAAWVGFDVDPNMGEQILLRKLAGSPIREFRQEPDNQATAPEIVIYDHGYEIGGRVYYSAGSRWHYRNQQLLDYLVRNAGKKITYNEILESTEFMIDSPGSSRYLNVIAHMQALLSQAEPNLVMQTGRLKGNIKWFGVGVKEDTNEIVDQVSGLETDEANQTKANKPAEEPTELTTGADSIQDAAHTDPYVDQSYVYHGATTTSPAELVRTSRERPVEANTKKDTLSEVAEESTFDFAQLRQLASNSLEMEILDYIIQRARQALDIADLVREATPVSIPADVYERQIFPALQARANQMGLHIRFRFNAFKVGEVRRKFLEIS